VTTGGLAIGVSLKMYFGQRQTLDWCREVAAMARRHPAVTGGRAELFVLPAAPLIDPVLRIFEGTGVGVGAQNLSSEDRGPFTGEVSGALLSEMGCRYAEVGHAERRRLFGEDDATAAAKVAACWRNQLTPVLCVGEPAPLPPADAARACAAEASGILGQAEAILQAEAVLRAEAILRAETSPDQPAESGRVILAYEPHWAIGQSEPAPTGHIAAVTAGLRAWLASRDELGGSRVIYGGSAGQGLLTTIRDSADGLFLGRFAHDPAALTTILDEISRTNAPRVNAASAASATS
jgi:triosephosphate isomerase (TIM)